MSPTKWLAAILAFLNQVNSTSRMIKDASIWKLFIIEV